MMRRTLKSLLVLPVWTLLWLAPGATLASEVDAQTRKVVTSALQRSLPEMPIEALFTTPVAGMVGVELGNGQTLFVTSDGQHLFAGDLYQLGSPIVNLAEDRRAIKRKKLMDAIPKNEMVVFSPEGPAKTYVSVFTDVDCGYCRKLHQEMQDINALGIEVRYLAYPRAGAGTPTYNKIVSAWCASNPPAALTALKAGQSVPSKSCDNPVDEQYELGQKVGVTGTPAIVTASGRLLPGYMPAADLAQAIGLQ